MAEGHTAAQIALPLDWPADPRTDDFLVSGSNREAARLLEHPGGWPVMTAVLAGPRKSGRSLLARIFAGRTGGRMIDDADRCEEAALFHAWNHAQEERRPLVLVAEAPPPEWRVGLADLRSRLAASPVARIGPPDDALVGALLRRQFERRGLGVAEEVVAWAAARIERSHVAVIRCVDVLDAAVLGRRRRLTVPLAREALGAAALIGDLS